MTYGMKLVLVGLVLKVVLSENISANVDDVFNNMRSASGAQLLMACLLYPIDMYGDFAGYTSMAIGFAAMFGLRLSPNFNRPFISTSTSDFWRRWHISLSSWVRDYLYLPLAGEFRHWGRWGVSLSLLITFVVLGIWHGAGWNFVVYGLIQGLVIIFEQNTLEVRRKIKERVGNVVFSTYSILRTYIIFALSLVFFKCPTLADACYFISHISLHVNQSWKEINLGMRDHTCIVAGVALVLVLIYEYFMDRVDLLSKLSARPAWRRWTFITCLPWPSSSVASSETKHSFICNSDGKQSSVGSNTFGRQPSGRPAASYQGLRVLASFLGSRGSLSPRRPLYVAPPLPRLRLSGGAQ